MCGVASGHTDAYYEFGPHIWDYAAAHLIAMEAGATVTSPNGELSHIISPSLSLLKYNPYCMYWSCSPSALLREACGMTSQAGAKLLQAIWVLRNDLFSGLSYTLLFRTEDFSFF